MRGLFDLFFSSMVWEDKVMGTVLLASAVFCANVFDGELLVVNAEKHDA